jgi:isopenicillin N synthase-like dioxygenase
VIPTLDLSGIIAGQSGAAEQLAPALRQALEQVGFYCLVGHGVDPAHINGAFSATRDFHAQALPEKLQLSANEHNVGYMPVNGYVSRSSRITTSKKPNLVEAFFVKRDLPANHPDVRANKRFRSTNQWPNDLPGFRSATLTYMRAIESVCRHLLPVYALALELPANYFDAAFVDPQVTLRMSHYPPPETGDSDQYGVAPHTDSSFLTLLAHSGLPGLEIRLPDGAWHAAPNVDGAFIVNSGDMLRRWTNHRFLSTPHRVRNHNPGQDRYAIPFFFDATIDYPMACLPTCHDPDNTPRYEATTVMDYMLWFSNQYDHVREKDGDDITAPGVPDV